MKFASKVAAAVLLAGSLVPIASPTATAAGTVALPSGVPYDMVVDQAHGKVFVAGSKVAVTNLSGAVLGTIEGITNAKALALSADGSQVYVGYGTQIAVVDAASSTLVDTVPLGDGICPKMLAPASGKVFFIYGGCGTASLMGAVDLTTKVVTTSIPVETGARLSLKAIPGQPSALVAILGAKLAILDTVGGDTPTASIRTSVSVSTSSGLSVAPNGASVIAASGGKVVKYRTSDLTKVQSYAVSSISPYAVAIRSDGLIASATKGNSYSDSYDHLWIHKPGVSTPFAHLRYNSSGSTTAAPFMMAFGSNYLYGVFKKSSSSFSSLQVITPGPPATLTLTSDKSVYKYGQDAVLVAKLVSPTVSRKVNIFAKSPRRDYRLIKSGYVSASTRKLVVKVPDLKSNVTFRASFAGDAKYNAASKSIGVKVVAKVTISSSSTSMSGIYHRLPRAGAHVDVRVYTARPDQGCTRMIGYRLVSGSWSRFDSINCAVSSTGRFAIGLGGLPAGSKLKISARFAGSDWNLPSAPAYYYILLT